MMILAKPVYIIFQILSLSQILRVFVQYQGVSPKAIVTVPLTSFRNDTKDKPVEGEINWQWTQADGVTVIDSGSKTVTLSPGDQDRITVTVTGYPGDTFWVIGEIMPTTDHDIDLSNNITKTKVYITLKKPPATPPATKEDPSPGTRVNLRD